MSATVGPEHPPWVVLHVPHDSTEIPLSVRDQFLLDDVELANEIRRMTDHHTFALFAGDYAGATVVRAPVSRLVVDVERFEDDGLEPMAARGMGAIYTVTSGLQPLRRILNPSEREALLATYYQPHHNKLAAAVTTALAHYGQCLVLDCHSFPEVALPYERRDPQEKRPDICLGTDEFHTSEALVSAFVAVFEKAGFQVAVNNPFVGALVPSSRYRKDPRVSAIMVEVNRGLYLNDADATPLPSLADLMRRIRRCCREATLIGFRTKGDGAKR